MFGRRAGLGAADYVRGLSSRPVVSDAAVAEAAAIALQPFNGPQGQACRRIPTPCAELQQTMNDLVGIIRTGDEMQRALNKIEEFKVRYRNIESDGKREFNPAGTWRWTCATCCWSANAWPVPDWPAPRAAAVAPATTSRRWTLYWRRHLVVCKTEGNDPVMPEVRVSTEEQPAMREDLLELFEIDELDKYFTDQNWRNIRDGEADMSYQANLKVWRGDDTTGELHDFQVQVNEGEVVLDIIHRLQAEQAPISRSGGTARPASAVPVRRRSTAVRGCCA